MEDAPIPRFRRAFWRAFLEADTIRLRQWERSHVTLPQLRVLYHLRRNSGATTGELARRLGITVSTTSGLVIKLVDRELVARGSLADDRRQAPLSLTESGTALLGDLSDEMRTYMEEVAARLGGDLDAVTRALEILTEAASVERQSDPPRDKLCARATARPEPQAEDRGDAKTRAHTSAKSDSESDHQTDPAPSPATPDHALDHTPGRAGEDSREAVRVS